MFGFLGYGFVDLSMIGIIIIGILIGIEHTFEIDHVVAVSTLVSQKRYRPLGNIAGFASIVAGLLLIIEYI